VVKTKDGEVMAKELTRQSARKVELMSLNHEHPVRTLDVEELDWISRIAWASQQSLCRPNTRAEMPVREPPDFGSYRFADRARNVPVGSDFAVLTPPSERPESGANPP
jgi:hypothetical protein